jgi:plasmid stability protein
MAQLTVRGVPDDVKKELERRARAEGLSVNRVVVNMLRENVRAEQEKARRRQALRRFVGSWSKEDVAELKERLAEMRQIDEDMWREEATAGHVGVHSDG